MFPLLLQDAGGHQGNAACDATSCTLLVIFTSGEFTIYKFWSLITQHWMFCSWICNNLILYTCQVPYQPNSEFVYFNLDDMRKHHYSIPEKTVVFVGEGLESQRVVLYNSLTGRRQELVTLRVPTPNVKVSLCWCWLDLDFLYQIFFAVTVIYNC
jgi:hypothetical protein